MGLIAETAMIESLTQFGVAGLMGVLWLFERVYSRRREQELSEAHARMLRQREELDVLVSLVQRNTAAIERFEQTEARLASVIDRVVQSRDAA